MPHPRRAIPIIVIATQTIKQLGPYIEMDLPEYEETKDDAYQALADIGDTIERYLGIIDTVPEAEAARLEIFANSVLEIVETVSKEILFTSDPFYTVPGECETCQNPARYGIPGDKIGRFCNVHKEKDMQDLKNKRCKVCYWFRADKGDGVDRVPLYCRRCVIIMGETEFKTVTIAKCTADPECKTAATCGLAGTTKKLTCAVHGKEKGYVDIHSKKCADCDINVCKWAIKGEDIVKYCGDCVRKNKYDAYARHRARCSVCGITAHYGMMGRTPDKCSKHMEEGMERLDGCCVMCKTANKDTIAKYGFPGEKKRTHCLKHALAGMENTSSNKCMHESGCETAAVFNMPGCTIGIRCGAHKDPGMVNINEKQCIGCKAHRAFYGRLGESPTHCDSCKNPGMIFNPNAFCKVKGCASRKRALYGTDFALNHCEKHKIDTDEKYTEASCTLCKTHSVVNSAGKCEECISGSNILQIQAKQQAMTKYLISAGLKPKYIDKTLKPGFRDRPDMFYDRGDMALVVECDENQHRGYSDELERMKRIYEAAEKPVVFIRFNPDSYQSAKPQVYIADRHKLLAKFVASFISDELAIPTNAKCSAMYLYYNGWNTIEDTNFTTILE